MAGLIEAAGIHCATIFGGPAEIGLSKHVFKDIYLPVLGVVRSKNFRIHKTSK